jgi:tetratricopeptide (TPR) repeat protein
MSFNKQAAKIRTRFAVPHGNIGFIHLQRQDIDKAIGSLRRALSFDPQFIQARTSLAGAYLLQKDYVSCIQECEKVVEQEPTFGPAWNNLGIAYLETGKLEKAAYCFDKALETGYEVEKRFLDEVASCRA